VAASVAFGATPPVAEGVRVTSQTFGALLREYAARTGISDAELARHLGVSRQTVFRWKEEHVAAPRDRERVLLCAARLRLTPDERDQLLLAAGFRPETPGPGALVGGGPPAAISPAAESSGSAPREPAAGALSEPAPRAPAVDASSGPAPREPAATAAHAGKMPLILTAFAVAGLAIGALALRRDTDARPLPARAGESLILVAVGSIGAEPANPLRRALEREVVNLRLPRVRVDAWPEPLNAAAASEALQRSRASVVVWHERDNAGSRLLNATDDGIQSLAITTADDLTAAPYIVLAEVLTARGDAAIARGVLAQAGALPELSPPVRARLTAVSATD
jgi:hypothetical protein